MDHQRENCSKMMPRDRIQERFGVKGFPLGFDIETREGAREWCLRIAYLGCYNHWRVDSTTSLNGDIS